MAENDRYERGTEMIKKVYAGDVNVPAKGAMAFSDLMVENLFAEVWTREVLSIRDRRLILLGVIGALGEKGQRSVEMSNLGLPVPVGFVLKADACRAFLRDPTDISADITSFVWNHA